MLDLYWEIRKVALLVEKKDEMMELKQVSSLVGK
jgi:hypothetical protein